MLRSVRLANFFHSLDNHQIKTTGSNVWFSLVVTLTASDNPYLTYPARGVIRVCEQGTHLGITTAIFHQFKQEPDGENFFTEKGTLDVPVEVGHPVFTFDGGI